MYRYTQHQAMLPSSFFFTSCRRRCSLVFPLFVTLTSCSPSTTATATTSRSMSFVTVRNGGTITISPKKEETQSGLVVISHGLGDTAEGLVDVGEVRYYVCVCICERERGLSICQTNTRIPTQHPSHTNNR